MDDKSQIPAGNMDRWRYFMKDIKSPNEFINMSFYSMISAALQRRVWLFSEERPLFPNLYVLLTGNPGVGKGLCLKPVAEMLAFHKIGTEKEEDIAKDKDALLRRVEQGMYDLEAKAGMKKEKTKPTLFPIASDSTTFEALIQANAKAVRFHTARSEEEKQSPFMRNGRYMHCSMAFVLEEISTLFRKKAEDVVNYLIKAFDCGDYVHRTKTQGTDIVTKCCLNFLGGTTPTFIRDTFDAKIFGDGFASRIIAVYGPRNRFNRFDMGNVSRDQIMAKVDLIQWILKLHSKYGRVTYAPDAYEYIKDYVENRMEKERPNKAIMLDSYYARKDIHVQKLAMAIHFSEYLNMKINIESIKKAIMILDQLEVSMDHALQVSGKNKAADQITIMERFIEKNWPVTRWQLLGHFVKDLTTEQFEEILSYLLGSDRVKIITVRKKNGKEAKVYAPNRGEVPDTIDEND